MVNVNYDSFYKFLVSLGIIMCTLPVTILLFLFTDSFNLQISEADLSEYTKTAQNVIRMKQFTPLLIEKWYTWLISAIFFLAGFFLICLGMKKWYQLQKFDDIRKKREAQEAMEAIKNILQICPMNKLYKRMLLLCLMSKLYKIIISLKAPILLQ